MFEPVSLAPRVCPSPGYSQYRANLRPARVSAVKTAGHPPKVIAALDHPPPAIVTAVNPVGQIATGETVWAAGRA